MKPSKASANRKLAVIMFADIVGYTAMMQRDEQYARKSVAIFKETLHVKVPAFNGNIIQYFGDGSLISFASSVDALNCALELQTAFQSSASVPVRIGLHSGDVVFEEENAFGDTVNLASRIESLGIPGSVLFSKKVHTEIKNQVDLQSKALGTFSFKNVEEPMELFALSNDGLIVPKRSEMQGKLKEGKPSFGNKYALAIAVSLAFILLLSLFFRKQTPAPTDFHTKRVAVMVFENKTQQEELEVFGNMVSDWLTKGLMEMAETQVISSTNIQPQVKQAGILNLESPDFAKTLGKSTGIEIMVRGRYYLLDGQLSINGEIVNTKDGQVLFPLHHIEGSRENMTDLLDELTHQVLGYWQVKGQKRFEHNPPRYDAYQAFIQAEEQFITAPARSAKNYEKAFELDSNFFEPMFRLYSLNSKEGNDSLNQPLLNLLERRKDDFTKWQKVDFDQLKARKVFDWLTAAQLSELQLKLDPSNFNALYNAVGLYNYANHPQKALDLIEQGDNFLKPPANPQLNWAVVYEVYTNYRLGNYNRVLQLANEYDFPKIPDALAVLHCHTLIKMGKMEDFETSITRYEEIGLLTVSGQATPLSQFLPLVCDELLISEKVAALQSYAEKLKYQAEANPEDSEYHHNLGYAYFFLGDLPNAIENWELEQPYPDKIPGWMRFPRIIEHLSRLGYCYAQIGQEEKAQKQLKAIFAYDNGHSELPGIQYYYQARILAALGQTQEAISSLRKAFENGFFLFRPSAYGNDPFLKPLMEETEFIELIRPKG